MQLTNQLLLGVLAVLGLITTFAYLINVSARPPPSDHLAADVQQIHSDYQQLQADIARMRDDLKKKDKQIEALQTRTEELSKEVKYSTDKKGQKPTSPPKTSSKPSVPSTPGVGGGNTIVNGVRYVDGVPDYNLGDYPYAKPMRPKAYKTEYGQLEKDNVCDRTVTCTLRSINYNDWGGKVPGFCEFSNLKCRQYRTFMGVREPQRKAGSADIGMFAASWADVMFIEFVFAQNQQMKDITEFGTASGLTSVYMGLIAKIRNGTIHTFDWKNTISKEADTVWIPNVMTFFQEDLLGQVSSKAQKSLERAIQIAYFDNGDKPKEVNVYSKFLPVGSILMTHDWEVEIFPNQIEAVLQQYGFEPLYEDMSQMLGTHVRAWKRVKEAGETKRS